MRGEETNYNNTSQNTHQSVACRTETQNGVAPWNSCSKYDPLQLQRMNACHLGKRFVAQDAHGLLPHDCRSEHQSAANWGEQRAQTQFDPQRSILRHQPFDPQLGGRSQHRSSSAGFRPDRHAG